MIVYNYIVVYTDKKKDVYCRTSTCVFLISQNISAQEPQIRCV